MTWSHVTITISPNEQLLSTPWQNPRFYIDGESKSFILQYEAFNTAQCTAQWLQHVPSHPWRLVYTQIHHARRQVVPLFKHKKTYSLVERNLDNKLDGNKTLSHQLLRHPINNECPGPPAPPGFWRLRSHDGPTASPKLRPNLRVIFSTDILSRFDSLVDCLIDWLVAVARLWFGKRCKKGYPKESGKLRRLQPSYVEHRAATTRTILVWQNRWGGKTRVGSIRRKIPC